MFNDECDKMKHVLEGPIVIQCAIEKLKISVFLQH